MYRSITTNNLTILYNTISTRIGSVRQLAVPARLGLGLRVRGDGPQIGCLPACLPVCSIPDPGSGSLSVPCRALDCMCTHIHPYIHTSISIYIDTHTSICLAYNVASDSSIYKWIYICTHTHPSPSLPCFGVLHPTPAVPGPWVRPLTAFFPQQLTAVRQLAAFFSS